MKTPSQPQAAAHTPTPWKVLPRLDGSAVQIVGGDGNWICAPDRQRNGKPAKEENFANAAFIVTACNAYAANQRTIEELREALEEAAEIIEAKFGGRYVKARAALANSQTKEGQP